MWSVHLYTDTVYIVSGWEGWFGDVLLHPIPVYITIVSVDSLERPCSGVRSLSGDLHS